MRRSFFFLLLLAAALASMANECSGPAQEDLELSGAGGNNSDPALRSAFANLATHNLRDARYDFLVARDRDPSNPDAQIGASLTSLLLLPELSPNVIALIEALGGAPPQMQERIYGDQGLLQALGQDDPARRDAALDVAFPWPQAEIEAPNLLADRLPDALSLQDLADHLPALADELRLHGDELLALADVAQAPFTFPATTFHGRTRVQIGGAELSLLSGVLRASAGALRWVAAYDWSLPIEQLRSSRTLEERVASLNAVAFRALRDPDALPVSREDLRASLDALIQALRYANQREGGSLGWHDLRAAQLDALAELLRELQASLDGPSALRGTVPQATLDLSPLFAGRLAPDDGLLRVVTPEDSDEPALDLDHDALQAMFFDGLMSPPCDLFSEPAPSGPGRDDGRDDGPLPDACPEFRADDEDLGGISEAIFGGFLDGVEDDYRL